MMWMRKPGTPSMEHWSVFGHPLPPPAGYCWPNPMVFHQWNNDDYRLWISPERHMTIGQGRRYNHVLDPTQRI